MPQSCVQNQLHIFLYCYCASGKFHHSWGIWSYPTEKNSRFLSFAGTENETEDLNIQTVDRNDTYITAWLALMYCIRAFVFQNLGGGGGGWSRQFGSSSSASVPGTWVFRITVFVFMAQTTTHYTWLLFICIAIIFSTKHMSTLNG
jgi:hypothetical protein